MADGERQDIVSLREYLERLIKEMEKRVEQRSDLEAYALRKAEEAMTARLEGMNEIRRQLATQKSEFVSTEKHEAEIRAINARLGRVETSQANMAGRWAMLGLVGGVIVVAINLGMRVLFG